MSRMLHAAVVALTGCVTIHSAGCRQHATVPDQPEASAPSARSAADPIEPDPTAGADHVHHLLAFAASQKLPLPASFQPFQRAGVAAVRSTDLPPRNAWELWSFFHAQEPESGIVPVIVPAGAEPDDDNEPIDRAREAAAARLRDALSASEQTDARGLFQKWEQERRAREQELNESMARVRAGAPRSELDRNLAELCRRSPAQCGPSHELDDQRRALDAIRLTTAPHRSAMEPAWSFFRDAPGLPGRARTFRLWLVQTSPWLVPAALVFGGWNDCPVDAEHAVVWRDWHARFGASIVYLDRDTIEAWVERPPAPDDERKRLAWEQYLYCEDIVSQGTGRVSALAQELSGRTWFFWWD